MKSNLKIITTFALLSLGVVQAQVGIGTTNSPDASAVLEIKPIGSAVGLLLPRLTTAQRDASIKSPSAGLVIYNSTTNTLQLANNNSLWFDVVNATTNAVTSGVSSSTGKVGVGTNSPDANAVLDVSSTTKGVLLPRMTTAEINAIATPTNGLMAYNTTLNKLCIFENSTWQQVTTTAM